MENESKTVHGWFGLTYAAYLTIPRLALENMPADWQRRFVELMEEFEASGIESPNYHVLRADEEYTTTQLNDPDDPSSWPREFYIQRADPWANYRYGSVAEAMAA